ncbi:MAG: class I SAM-dependent methyltransferase [Stellaceae bacterium]
MSKAALEKAISDSHYQGETEYERSSKEFMRSLVPADRQLHILDIGCGTGLNAGQLARAGHTIMGIDLSPVAIERLHRNGFEGAVCDIDTESLPVPQASFDLVYASEVIEHCADTAGFLAKLHHALKPGGMLLLSTPNSAFWAYRLLALLGRTLSECQHPGHIRFFSKRGLKAAVEQAGFQVTGMAARSMYLVIGKRIGDPVAPLLQGLGFVKEARFATRDHFWQLSRCAKAANPFWADTLIVMARKVSR